MTTITLKTHRYDEGWEYRVMVNGRCIAMDCWFEHEVEALRAGEDWLRDNPTQVQEAMYFAGEPQPVVPRVFR